MSSSRFELPIDGIVHHLFETDRVVDVERATEAIPSIVHDLMNQQTQLVLPKETWETVIVLLSNHR